MQSHRSLKRSSRMGLLCLLTMLLVVLVSRPWHTDPAHLCASATAQRSGLVLIIPSCMEAMLR